MKVRFKKLSDGAITPTLATDGSCAFDLYVPCDFLIEKGRNIIPTDIALEMPRNIKANIRARSGFSAKGFEAYKFIIDKNNHFITHQLPTRINADVILGLADSDYRGAIGIICQNNETESYIVKKGTRIAQLEFCVVPVIELEQADELSETERGNNGFGHSGTM